MYANLCVYSGDSKMLLSAQAQRLINIHLSKFIQHRLTQPAAALHLETKLVKLAFVNVRSYMWTLFFCVCIPLITSTFTFILLLINNYARLILRRNMTVATQEFHSKLKAKLQLSTFSSLLRWLKTDSITFQYLDFDGSCVFTTLYQYDKQDEMQLLA